MVLKPFFKELLFTGLVLLTSSCDLNWSPYSNTNETNNTPIDDSDGGGNGGNGGTADTVAPSGGSVYFDQMLLGDPVAISWDEATDNRSVPSKLQYKLVAASSASDIDTIEEAEAITGADLLMNWSMGTTSTEVNSLLPMTTYYFAVVVKDEAGNKTLYSNYDWDYLGAPGLSAGQVFSTSIALDSNNTPYVAYMDLAVAGRAVVKKFDGTNWVQVGDIVSTGNANNTRIAIDKTTNSLYVSYGEGSLGGRATVKTFDTGSGTWVTLGSAGFSSGPAYSTTIALNSLGVPHVAYMDNGMSDAVTVMKYDAGLLDWVPLGPIAFSVSNAYYPSLTIDTRTDVPYVVYGENDTGGKATVSKYDDGISDWVTVGASCFSDGQIQAPSIAIDSTGTPYVAYQDDANSNRATVKKFDGANWVTVGTEGFSIGQSMSAYVALDSNNTPYISYADGGLSGGKSVVKTFDGTNWINLGTQGFTAGTAYYSSLVLDPNDVPYVAYKDSSTKASVMKYGEIVPTFRTK